MELDALGGQLAMAHRHDEPVRAGALLQRVRKGRLGDERVVATDLQRGRQAAEDRPAVMLDAGGLAVDRVVGHDPAPPRLHERLVPQADAQGGDPGLGEAPHRFQRDPRLVGRARPGRDDHAVVAADEQLVHGGVVVADDLDLGGGVGRHPHVLDEVVGEAVVVVDDEDPHPGQP